MSAGDPVSVQILDKEYLIACPPEEQEDLQRAATLLNQRLRQIREHGKVMGTERLVIMAALNMANELAKIASREERSTAELGARVRGMRERVERALVHGQQLEL
ncbi:MAG: cell division protein ZapA [Proteobacteria bacterium]|jgi:cell division protein ZapA|nr:cell division protein ZapA [Pseudomonadota bacterium]MCC6633581.1 cell division protein ZapA [Gammaproteobacteria bacterium]